MFNMMFKPRENKNLFTRTKVKELSPRHFDEFVTFKVKDEKPRLVLFYVPWCPYCIKYKDMQVKLAEKLKKCVSVEAFNCEKYNEHTTKINMDYMAKHKKKLITSYPTLVFYVDGKCVKFEGERSEENIMKFILKACKKCKC